MNRVVLGLVAAIAAIAAIAVVATTGSAQSDGPTTLNLVAKSQNSVGYFPKGKPKQGQGFGFGDKITGDETGVDRATCSVIGTHQALCNVVAQLSKGTITVSGLIRMSGKANNEPLAITGGTGAYDGARGTVFVTDMNSNTTNLKVVLLP